MTVFKYQALALALAACFVQQTEAATLNTLNGQAPLVIAHRGASGYLPEHTLAGYELAVKLGADYIEPDLQLTKDGYLVAMHDTTLNRTTNVAAVLGKRNNSYAVSGYTLAEIKQLTVLPTGTGKTTYPGFTPSSPDAMRVPTFDEVIALAQTQSALTGRTVGIYPEAKIADPLMEDKILSTLAGFGYGKASDKVVIQSFSLDTLTSLRAKQNSLGMTIQEVFLGNSAAGSFTDLAKIVNGIGPSITNNGANAVTAAYIEAAHAAGLMVHGYTFAQANPDLAAAQYDKYFGWGMDGVFTNYTDLGVTARNELMAAVPEPGSYALMLGGLGLLGLVRRQRRG
ncbi:glycerophosphodiester phosphodiesterase family protein [Roseateles toxinivorans]|uniref:Glycerophosphoryl diester phosphodiesterase n=1 Tax=Roseateles toxinivorans TaxID=270368 RepID=A0A4R6QFB0_9BURK|nr:glycerophosphodiester phosphodiesterase family protein [Roseateles toxinivorans]TDP60633.1 glycerophosphoryl diester phosphodiesterase [Roseateles toxinivorans]